MKTLAIMQPYFFPYLGYFMLMQNASRFFLLEDVQFIHHGWIERNRILKPSGDDWQYIKVPLKKHSQKTLIKDIEIDNSQDWKKKIFSQLEHYKKKTRFYNQVIDVIRECLNIETVSITLLNQHIMQTICNYLSITTPVEIISLEKVKIEEPRLPDEWALNICKAMGYSQYVNPPGGQSFFDREKYLNNGVKLFFLNPILKEYKQGNFSFISGLSVIDVLMFNSVQDIKCQLSAYTLL